MLLGTLTQEAHTCVSEHSAQPGQSFNQRGVCSEIWDIQARLHTTCGWVRPKTWDFVPRQGFLQAQTELWAAADPDPPLPIPIPACCNRTHSAMQAKGIHAALHSSELFPAMVYQCISTGRSWCPFSSPLLTHSPLRRRQFLLSLHCVHYKHTRRNTSSHIPQQQGPAFSVTPLRLSLLLLSIISPILLPYLSVKRGWTKYCFCKCSPN